MGETEPIRVQPQRLGRLQHQHPYRWIRGGDLAGRFDPVQLRHADVHQHDGGTKLSCECDRRFAVVGFAAHFEIRLGVQDQGEAGADERLVVGEQNADQGLIAYGRRPAS